MNRKSKIYVTGHRGMVGSAIVENLKAHGYTNLITATSKNLDLRIQANVEHFIKNNRPEYVIHTAAKVGGIQANVTSPVEFLNDNIQINSNIMSSCLNNNVENFLFLGSSCMYPKDYKNPLKEEYILNAPLEPTNEGYALSKIVGAKFCEYVHQKYALNYKTIIPCNLFGEKDHFLPNRSHLLAAIIDKMYKAKAENEESVTIWGEGTARREFLYVKDLADFIVENLDSLSEFPDLLNIGYGKDYSVKEYYEMIGDIMNYEGRFEYDLSKPTGMKFKLIDSSKATKLGWEPKHSLKDALIKTCNYYENEIGK